MSALRVVVVEDSPTQRLFLTRVLQSDGDIVVVGEAVDAQEAVEQVAGTRPDVVTMDLRIPLGGGQHAIETIMATVPTPILVLSAAVEGRHSTAAFDALAAGAVDVLPKPDAWMPEDERRLRARVRTLQGVKVVRHMRRAAPPTVAPPPGEARRPVVGLAASTGGPAALLEVLRGLRGVRAPVLVVQHLDADFLPGFVTWLGREAGLPVELATSGRPVEDGLVLVAPGGVHLGLDPELRVHLDPEPVTLHRPSADRLFASLASAAGAGGVGVVLTGMGDDGAEGLAALRRAGGVTIAQDEPSSVVFGMPRAAHERGAVDRVAPLAGIAGLVRAAVESRRP